jgi:hypothetical protein
VAAWILTPPAKLTDEQRAGLDAIIARCPELAATRTLVRQFGDMLTHRQGTKLPGWADQAEASDVPEIRSFAAGLRKDWAAVTAGLTLPWSSGTVEGHVNRIKMIKGRCTEEPSPTSCANASCSASDTITKMSQSHFLMAMDSAHAAMAHAISRPTSSSCSCCRTAPTAGNCRCKMLRTTGGRGTSWSLPGPRCSATRPTMP